MNRDSSNHEADSADASCNAWTYWNDGLSGGEIGRVQFDPRVPGLAFATAGRQLYRSNDSGQTWRIATTDAGANLTQLEFPAANPGMLLAVTSSGLRRSADAGQTWTTLSLDGLSLTSLLFDPTSPQRLFAGGDQGLLMRSTDGGSTWRVSSSGLPFGQVTSLVGDPGNPDNVVAGVVLEDDTGAWKPSGVVARSTNGGTTWSTALSVAGFVERLSQCYLDARVVYASTAIGISKTVDGGVTWGPILRAGTEVTDVAIDPTNCEHIHAALFPSGITESLDGGATWSPPSTQGIALQSGYQFASSLAPDPNNASILLASTHDGVFRSTDAGSAWSRASGFQSIRVVTLKVSAVAPEELWMGSFGSGAWRRPTPQTPWQRVTLEQLPREWLITVHPDEFTPGRIMIGASVGGGDAWRSSDRGTTFQVTNAVSVNPFAFATDPTDNNVEYMGTQLAGVYKSIDGGASWQASNTGATTAFVRSLFIDSDPGHTIYAGTETQGLLRSADAGGHWESASAGLGSGSIQGILRFATTANSSLFAWVEGSGVYRSSDGATWSPTNAGLTALNSGGIAVDVLGSRLFAVAGGNVFSSADGENWDLFDAECPAPLAGGIPVIVISGATRYLVVSAGSNGVLAHAL